MPDGTVYLLSTRGYPTYGIRAFKDGYVIKKPYEKCGMTHVSYSMDLVQFISDWVIDYNRLVIELLTESKRIKDEIDIAIPEGWKVDVHPSGNHFLIVIECDGIRESIPYKGDSVILNKVYSAVERLRVKVESFRATKAIEDSFKHDLKKFLDDHKAHLEVKSMEEYSLCADVDGLMIDITEL